MKIKIGISPIAWLNDDMPILSKGITVEKCLSEIVKCGYTGVENCGSFPKNKKAIQKLLNRFNLKFSGGWYSANLIKNSVNSEFSKMKSILQIFKVVITYFAYVHMGILQAVTRNVPRAYSENNIEKVKNIKDLSFTFYSLVTIFGFFILWLCYFFNEKLNNSFDLIYLILLTFIIAISHANNFMKSQ